MARGPVWIEAYEQYLLRKNVCEKSKLERLSDDALAEKYFQYVEETDCKEDTFDWVHKWTIVNKVDRRREKNQKRSSN